MSPMMSTLSCVSCRIASLSSFHALAISSLLFPVSGIYAPYTLIRDYVDLLFWFNLFEFVGVPYDGHRFTRCGGQVLTIACFFSPVYVTFSAYHVLARSVVCEYSDPLDIGLAVSPSSSDCVAFLARTPTSPKHPLIVCEGPEVFLAA
ncbi:hypothetical protein EMIHUDRAFT_211977 [Emiliania huxleyi CCMP1516]|uniref:Uncharacterized protein n=2 Tax=Emiliania huxleyi TaxID=2903 RepID=A0A0D3IS06_EMIH1|nr:hypothetical protein EMIHUDRAFT_211977 [Emiliania huxleyi CCMP1516]EOD14041.1 hypothetical protein EMIHUDRAFT_211977 [Emiliania huxleyi CCMP1516]|eukprot:XP_005766470.1 hypothetical protein EMIHUDRAFT_211977 [Emiliania huxleyi CCMP1516]